jgi:hypothetical protein
VSADETFVLVLIIVCVAIVGSAAIHSRRQRASVANTEAQPASPDAPTPQPPPAGAARSPHIDRRKRRKR